jgi:hypothetical protein
MYGVLGGRRIAVRIEFARAVSQADSGQWVTPDQLEGQGIAFAYVSAKTDDEQAALNALGRQLNTAHPPYDVRVNGWLRLWDDLVAHSFHANGIMIIIDNADGLFSSTGMSWGETFLKWWSIQLDDWIKKSKPCHLVFQMQSDPDVSRIYSSGL